jgi:hypothetical protein
MTRPRNKNLLLNWIFLLGLFLLALNDHFLKYHYSSWLTGKLSDFTGLLIFPLFLAFLFPRQAKAMPLLTGICFIFFKAPWSTPFIEAYNRIAPIGITRTIDYSDLLALAVLPLSQRLIPAIDRYRIQWPMVSRLQPVWLMLPCSFVFMATSAPRYYYLARTHHKGEVYVGASFKVKMSVARVLETMKREGYDPLPDTSVNPSDTAHHYRLENVIFAQTQDTVQSIRFSLFAEGNDRTELFVRDVTHTGDRYISDWRLLKMYAKYYRYLVSKQVVRELK